jgi:hypothetical protein
MHFHTLWPWGGLLSLIDIWQFFQSRTKRSPLNIYLSEIFFKQKLLERELEDTFVSRRGFLLIVRFTRQLNKSKRTHRNLYTTRIVTFPNAKVRRATTAFLTQAKIAECLIVITNQISFPPPVIFVHACVSTTAKWDGAIVTLVLWTSVRMVS